MASTRAASPLATAALSYVGTGITASDLADRFTALDVFVPVEVARAWLEELRSLGLVRVSRGTAETAVYVTTSLAQRTHAAAASDEHAALLRDLEQMRTDFLSTVAHELRTPLTVVRTNVGLLRDITAEPTADQRATLLETIDRNAQRMQRLVDDTLDLTRFREGRIRLQLRRFDASDLARSVVASFPSRPGSVSVVTPSEPVWVFADRRRLEHALVNLVSNARKYSPPEAPIEVSVSTDDASVSWSVVDHGSGIAADERERLFERFFVGRNGRSGPVDGVGLGLPIALATVQAHGGTIEVNSEPGKGSRFTIVVPAAGPERGQDD